MKPTRSRSAVVLTLVLLECTQNIFAAPVPSVANETPDKRIGIITTDSFSSSELVVVRRLEKRLQRSLENVSPWRPTVEVLPGTLTAEALDLESKQRQLIEELSLLRRSIFDSESRENGSSELLSRIEALEKALKGVYRLGPLIQRSLVLKAAFYWKSGQRAEAKKIIKEAILMHPAGHLDELHSWESDGKGFNALVFEQEISDLVKNVRRHCSVDLEISSKVAISGATTVFVNGFEVNPKKTLNLAQGKYEVWAIAGPSFAAQTVRCERTGRQAVALKLGNVRDLENPREATLAEIAGKHDLESLLVIDRKRSPAGGKASVEDQIELHLFTPSLSLIDEVPLKKPLRLADSQMDVGEKISDATLPLFQKHSRTENQSVGSPSEEALRMDSGVSAKTSEWYNNWVFWAVAGGVLGAATIIYFGTRSSPVEIKSPAGGIAVKFE